MVDEGHEDIFRMFLDGRGPVVEVIPAPITASAARDSSALILGGAMSSGDRRTHDKDGRVG